MPALFIDYMELFDKKIFEQDVKKMIKDIENSRHNNKEELEDAVEDYVETLPKDMTYLASLIDYLKTKGIDESKIDPRDAIPANDFSTLDFLIGKATVMLGEYCLIKMEK